MHLCIMRTRFFPFLPLLTLLASPHRCLAIHGGEKTDDYNNHIGFMAHIYMTTNEKELCGGSLINDNTVLTVAHYFHNRAIPSDFKVYLGHADRRTKNPAFIFNITKIITHHLFTIDNFMNNIAILKISPKVNFDKEKYERRIWKACLPLSYSSTDNFEWDKCKAYGWGQDKNKDDKSDFLKEVTLPKREDEECSKFSDTYDFDRQLCAGNDTLNHDVCPYDQGGPLVCPLNRGNDVIPAPCVMGIISHQEDCGKDTLPAYFTRVSNFPRFIKRYANKSSD